MTHPNDSDASAVRPRIRPAIALVQSDTLSAIGLKSIIEKMMPAAEVSLFSSTRELLAERHPERFYHFFVSSDLLLSAAAFFLSHRHRTIVLVRGEETSHLPEGFHQLDVHQGQEELVRSIVRLAHTSHSASGKEPEAVKIARGAEREGKEMPRLTPREKDVLREVVMGNINKVIADRLGISLATVITHRKNLTMKLGTRSVATLTLYAVTHGIVNSEALK
ncbi:MAG: helix-turn-helix transcriptional regulator [Bacteroidales bacterium]|nr:helix-turn-helix transcriptional regulator [Bacteroidales bacterium]MDY4620526.1 helix-turn-helix transcriptional regulator [Alloprevotella sp.]